MFLYLLKFVLAPMAIVFFGLLVSEAFRPAKKALERATPRSPSPRRTSTPLIPRSV